MSDFVVFMLGVLVGGVFMWIVAWIINANGMKRAYELGARHGRDDRTNDQARQMVTTEVGKRLMEVGRHYQQAMEQYARAVEQANQSDTEKINA